MFLDKILISLEPVTSCIFMIFFYFHILFLNRRDHEAKNRIYKKINLLFILDQKSQKMVELILHLRKLNRI
jgi:hypothetical protein